MATVENCIASDEFVCERKKKADKCWAGMAVFIVGRPRPWGLWRELSCMRAGAAEHLTKQHPHTCRTAAGVHIRGGG